METNPAATSLTVLEMLRAGRFAQIHEMLVPQLPPMLTAEAIQTAWAAELGRHGQVASIASPVSEPAQGGVVVVKVPVTYERGELALVISVTEAGQLAGIQLAPASSAEGFRSSAKPPLRQPVRSPQFARRPRRLGPILACGHDRVRDKADVPLALDDATYPWFERAERKDIR